LEHTGHVRIERKIIPYHLKDFKVNLIPNNTYAALLPSDIKEKEMIKGFTTGNREVAFIGCRYNDYSLGYKALVISNCNTGLHSGITKFDRICFKGKAVNTFAGPGRAFVSEAGFDISERMKAITPKKWDEVNTKVKTNIGTDEIQLSVDFSFWHNLKYAETSMGEAIPQFSLEYARKKDIKSIPKIYLMVHDFFCFLNFRRNISFDKVTLQIKEGDVFETIATVHVNTESYGDYDRSENNTIISRECNKFWGDLFKVVSLRRTQKIYDNFYIPKNSKEASSVTLEKYLACALSFESEYERLYPSKKDDNKSYGEVHKCFEKTADELSILFEAIKSEQLTFEEFLQLYYDGVNKKYNKLVKNLSKTKQRKTDGYCEKIKDALSKIDYSLSEKYKNAIDDNIEYLQPVIDKLCRDNSIEFPSYNEAGKKFADFRNEIAHGNPSEIECIHCVLYEVARALIYIMVLRQANADSESIKTIIKKLF
jgi:hypothetical protein